MPSAKLLEQAQHQSRSIWPKSVVLLAGLGGLISWQFCGAAVWAQPADATTAAPRTPAEVWKGFDPRAEPVEMEVLRRWEQDGAKFTEFYFTGMTAPDGKKVRVYGIASAPTNATNLPGMLHIHGGGQTAYEPWLKFWNARGYAALTFNWGGHWENREKFTDWGSLKQGNHRDSGAMLQATEPTVRASSWYLWTRISRRALTVLEQMPEVDCRRLGIFGVSMGGTIVWPFAAMDSRVKAACAIYGVGATTYPDELEAPDPDAADASLRLWRAAMEPESYAALIKCPILFLNASNDQHGKMDWAFPTLQALRCEWRQIHTPLFRHHIGVNEGPNLPLWMDTFVKGNGPVWPKPPEVVATLGAAGVPQIEVKADHSQPITNATLFYAVENRNPKNRHWRSVNAERIGNQWRAALPVLDVNQPLFAFANIYYANGIALGSSLLRVTPATLGNAKATDQRTMILSDASDDFAGWSTASPATDPLPPIPVTLVMTNLPGGTRALTTGVRLPLQTRRPGDPKWRAPKGAALRLQYHARVDGELAARLIENDMVAGMATYECKLRLVKSPATQSVTLQLSDFIPLRGVPLESWQNVQVLELDYLTGHSREFSFVKAEWVTPSPGAL